MAFSFFLNYRDDIKLQIRSKLCDIANKGQATRMFELRRKAQISKKMVINTVHPGKGGKFSVRGGHAWIIASKCMHGLSTFF